MADDLKLGATGEFPNGKLVPEDEGALNIKVGRHKNGTVLVEFGTPVVWFGMLSEQAVDFASTILCHAGVEQFEIKHGANVLTFKREE